MNPPQLWDYRAMSVVASYRHPAYVAAAIGSMGRGKCRVDLSPDSRWLLAGGADGAVFVWDVDAAAAGRADAVRILKHHKEAVVACGWAHSGAGFVTADKAGVVAFWMCR